MVNENEQRLTSLMKELDEAKAVESDIKQRIAELWDEAYQIFDGESGEARPFRYLDHETARVFGRQIRSSSSIDPAILKTSLGTRRWNRVSIEVTQRVFQPDLLEEEMKAGRISDELVRPASSNRITPARFGPRDATKEEKQQLKLEDARTERTEAAAIAEEGQ